MPGPVSGPRSGTVWVCVPQIITLEEAKRRKSTCGHCEVEDDAALPVLQPHSALLENMHVEQVGGCRRGSG